MNRLQNQLFATLCLVLFSNISNAACSDSEYSIYQRYDKFLEAYPSIPDYDLRPVFAKKVGMKPDALKNLYVRCTVRWTSQSPEESRAFAKSELEGLAKDCAHRSNDPACKAFFGR
jgi:hypothetical protein